MKRKSEIEERLAWLNSQREYILEQLKQMEIDAVSLFFSFLSLPILSPHFVVFFAYLLSANFHFLMVLLQLKKILAKITEEMTSRDTCDPIQIHQYPSIPLILLLLILLLTVLPPSLHFLFLNP